MNNPVSINADVVVNQLSDITKALSTEISAELKAGAEDIARLAKRNAPADQGFLQNQIGAKRESDFEYTVYSNSVYSPYVEFGTGEKVSIPPGLEDYAAQFKGNVNTSALSFKEAIFAWCQRHGIPEEAWYSILISIAVHGINPHPFFFPAVEQMRPIIIQRITDVVNDIVK